MVDSSPANPTMAFSTRSVSTSRTRQPLHRTPPDLQFGIHAGGTVAAAASSATATIADPERSRLLKEQAHVPVAR